VRELLAGQGEDTLSNAPRARKPLPQWLLEGMFIVVSVVLGFAAAQYGEYRSDRARAVRALESLQAEIEHNLAVLEPMVPLHGNWVKALAKADTSNSNQSGLDIYMSLRPPLPEGATPFPFLRRSAWDAALAGDALPLIDYDVTSTLSEIYRLQEIATGNVDRLAQGALSTPLTFDPASRAASVRLLWLTMADIQSAEQILLDLYRKHLPAIRAAASGQR
jgi:hypothetical protein